MSAATRLQQHTEVLSHILSFTVRQSLTPCLPVSTQFHAVASLHIDKIYQRITIGRDTIASVFQGVNWEDIEYKWTEEAERKRKTRGQSAIKNTAVRAFSYVALFEGTSWNDMDEGWKTPKESRNSPPSPPDQPTSKPRPPIYGSAKTQRHAWKVYALSKCKELTMCGTWTTSGLDTRYHTHNLLHNGKDHQLFPLVETVRIIPLASAHKAITPLCSAHGSCPFIQEISPKKLVHSNCMANGFALTIEPVDELVLFLPNGQWPDDMEYDYRVQTLEESLSVVNCNIIKLVFGPLLVDKNRSEHHQHIAEDIGPARVLKMVISPSSDS